MPIQLDAKLNAFRRSSKGFYITLEIGPDCDWTELAAAPLGQAFGVAMVPYDPETGKRTEPPKAEPKEEKPRVPFAKMKRAVQSGMLCNDKRFCLWLSQTSHYVAGTGDIKEQVRRICGVASRVDLDTNDLAARKWDELVTSFHYDTGQIAEVRG